MFRASAAAVILPKAEEAATDTIKTSRSKTSVIDQ